MKSYILHHVGYMKSLELNMTSLILVISMSEVGPIGLSSSSSI